jgi:DNA-binding transcriptional ArsR family regulator
MSHQNRSAPATRLQKQATVFAALGDETRLSLLARLGSGQRFSISQLASGSNVTRQAITKHLRVLESVKVVRCRRSGRERLFEFNVEPIEDLKQYLNLVSAQWDRALARLKLFVED